MKQTDKNIYRLKLKCEKCNKDIFVCFDIHIKEIPDYGPEESYKPIEVPKYLEHIIQPRYGEGFDMNPSMRGLGALTSNSPMGEDNRRYFILCRKCEKVENIKK